MLAKTGRPKSENPRDIRFTFRMNAHENKILEAICTITGENKNEVLRNAILRYYEYLKQIENSRIICEVVQKGQSGLTVRALEALFFEKKLITNNESIIEFDFYDSNNIFIFRDTTSENDIKNFLSL